MWQSLIQDSDSNLIVICDQVKLIRRIQGALYAKENRFTIILDPKRPRCISLDVHQLQVIHAVEEAIAIRNQESVKVSGWVLFMDSSQGLIHSLSSVASRVEYPEYSMLRAKLLQLYPDEQVTQIIDHVSMGKLNESTFWSVIEGEPENALRNLGILYKERSKISKYNNEYEDSLKRSTEDDAFFDQLLASIPEQEKPQFRTLVSDLKSASLGEFNFRDLLLKEIKQEETYNLLQRLDLPNESPQKIEISCTSFPRRNFFKVESDGKANVVSAFAQFTDVELEFTPVNSSCRLQASTSSGSWLEKDLEKDQRLRLSLIGQSQKCSFLFHNDPSLQKRFEIVDVTEETLGVYRVLGGELKQLIGSKALPVVGVIDVETEALTPNDSIYLIHSNNKQVRSDYGSVERLLSGQVVLSRIRGFDADSSDVFFSIGDVEYRISSYSKDSDDKSLKVANSLIKLIKTGLDYDGLVLTKDKYLLGQIEEDLLESDCLTVIFEDPTVGFQTRERTRHCSNVDSGKIDSFVLPEFPSELLSAYQKVRKFVKDKNLKSVDYLAFVEEIDRDLVDNYYEAYRSALSESRENMKFLTINLSIKESPDFELVVLPVFHPVVLRDLKDFILKYEPNGNRCHLNAHVSPQKLKSITYQSRLYVELEGSEVGSYVFVKESSAHEVEWRAMADSLGIDHGSKRVMSYLPLAHGQIERTLSAMFDYIGFKRRISIALKVDRSADLHDFVTTLSKFLKSENRLSELSVSIYLDPDVYVQLTDYYTSGLHQILIIKSDQPRMVDLVLDSRSSSSVKYLMTSFHHEYVPFGDSGYSIPIFRKNNNSFEAIFQYGRQDAAHRLMSGAVNGQALTVQFPRSDSDQLAVSNAKILTLQLEKFSAYENNVQHIIFEMKTTNRLKLNGLQQTNYVIAINSGQLQTRIDHALQSMVNVGHSLESIKKYLLRYNLFSFNQVFGNWNKMKGTIGELCVFHQFQLTETDATEPLLRAVPFDLIHQELAEYFKGFQLNPFSQYPDFLVMNLAEGDLSLHLVEVKSYQEFNIDHESIFNDQINPLENAISSWSEHEDVDLLEKKRFVIYLLEFILKTNYKLIDSAAQQKYFEWLDSTTAELSIGKSILIHLHDQGQSGDPVARVSDEDYFYLSHSFDDEVKNLLLFPDRKSILGEEIISCLFCKTSNPGSSMQNQNAADSREVIGGLSVSEFPNDRGQKEDSSIPESSLDVFEAEMANERKTLEKELQAKYVEVRRWLSRQGVFLEGVDQGMRMTPMSARFTYKLGDGIRVRQLTSLEEDLGLQLELQESQKLDVLTDLGNVIIEFPLRPRDRQFFTYSNLPQKDVDSQNLNVAIGVDTNGEVVTIEFGSESPHFLIAGTTGSGKSVALETIIGGLIERYPQNELHIAIIDPKQTELIDFERAAQIRENCLGADIGSSSQDAVELLERAVDEMERRLTLFRTLSDKLRADGRRSVKHIDGFNEASSKKLPKLLIVLDEYADLVSNSNDRKLIEELLAKVAQKARSVGIHLIVATQKPIVEVLSTVVKGNLPSVIALRVNTNSDSRVVLDESGAERLLGKGDSILKVGGKKIRFQIAKYDGAFE